MKRDKKTSSELIVDALRTGKRLKLSEITELMSQYSGTDIKIQNVSSTMAKLTDSEKTEIGHFISRNKTRQGYVYKLADEALALTPEQTYGLIRKVGKDRFTLKDAIENVPALKKHVKGHGTKKTRRSSNALSNPQASGAQEPSGKPTIAFSIGGAQPAQNQTENTLAQALEELRNGVLNINVNLNIRFIGFD